MYPVYIYTLKILRRLYAGIFPVNALPMPDCIQDVDMASKVIRDRLMADTPCMITRFGAFEMGLLTNYLGTKMDHHSVRKFIKGEELEWWWNLNHIPLHINAFPQTVEKIEQFCNLMIDDIPSVDILGSWLPSEYYFEKQLHNCPRIDLELLNPYFSQIPWTTALENKKVLVIHPFSQSIESQYKKKTLLFENQQILPEFELQTFKSVLRLGMNNSFTDWFDALNYMKDETSKRDFDIALLACGAYGFPLAAHIKRMGRKAFHLGGSLQLLFGIKGNRWENAKYHETYNYAALMNEHWIKPDDCDKPKDAHRVDNACYW